MKIWKYPLSHSVNQQTIKLPSGSHILTIHSQRNEVCAWVMVPDPSTDLITNRHIHCVATGEDYELPKQATFLGTAFIHGEVYHYFEG